MEALQRHYKISLSLLLVLIGLFFIPFNSWEGLPFLGEYARESATLFFLLAGTFVILKLLIIQKINLPYKHPIFLSLCILVLWFVVATILNTNAISDYYFKDTSGFKRFILQFISLSIALFFFITFYNAFRTEGIWTIFKYIRKTFLISFIIVSIYSILEILILKFGFRFLTQTLYLFDYFPFTESWLDYKNYRISSVTSEPPALATYLFTIAPWMLSYILTHKNLLKYLPAILVFVLTFFSGSRAGIFIIVVQYALFFIALINFSKWQKYVVRTILFTVLGGGILLLLNGKVITNYIVEKATSFALDDEDHSYSNRSRLGIVFANFQVFKHNPISGVGLGQQAFLAVDFYPAWAVKDNYEFEEKYLNPEVKNFPPGYNLYVRILAESGIIGFILFLGLIVITLYFCIIPILKKDKNALLYIICLISIIGMTLNWLKMDTFRVFTFWFTLAFLIMLTQHKVLVYRKP